MKCKVELIVAGKVFYESVHARDYDEARQVALARNPNATVIGVNADFFTNDSWNWYIKKTKTMKDQASIGNESASVKYQRALDLFTESVMKPDHDLRGCAYNQGCYEDLMEIREHVLEYLKTLKDVTYHTNPDESDDIETAKLIETKPLTKWR